MHAHPFSKQINVQKCVYTQAKSSRRPESSHMYMHTQMQMRIHAGKFFAASSLFDFVLGEAEEVCLFDFGLKIGFESEFKM